MAKIRKAGKKDVPAISTASLPDIIFMLLFFFMVSTSMKEVTYKVDIHVPEATELQSLEKKSLVRYIYIGEPKESFAVNTVAKRAFSWMTLLPMCRNWKSMWCANAKP